MSLKNGTILLTGGTGSFGKAFVAKMLSDKSFKGVIRIYSRDEFKQYDLGKQYEGDKRLRFLIGDVRDRDRLMRAADGCETIIHAAALKHVPILEYNPFEAVKTNILGSQNVIDAAIDNGVKKVLLISSDKAVSPVNLYGATKMVAEKIFVDAHAYAGDKNIIIGVVRYGNVIGSRGSVVPLFIKQASEGVVTITDERMTRFWITLEQGVVFVLKSLENMDGGEIFIPKIPSIKIVNLVRAIAPKAKIKTIGIRPGEKIHESLISVDESRHAYDFGDHFEILPEFVFSKKIASQKKGKSLPDNFSYSSDKNDHWLSEAEIAKLIGQIVTS